MTKAGIGIRGNDHSQPTVVFAQGAKSVVFRIPVAGL